MTNIGISHETSLVSQVRPLCCGNRTGGAGIGAGQRERAARGCDKAKRDGRYIDGHADMRIEISDRDIDHLVVVVAPAARTGPAAPPGAGSAKKLSH